ncbi:MAG TPA: GDYXXLXY domain-containing protein [Planctomycetota bacterium]|nr:GDYXXLXY domain-containing protein [Planctomycetota bacterium]
MKPLLSKKTTNLLVMGNLLLFLAAAAWLTSARESQLSTGRTLLLEVEPYGRRSPLNGNSMILRYVMAREIEKRLLRDDDHGDGHAVISIDATDIGRLLRKHDGSALAANEYLLHYRLRSSSIDRVRVAPDFFSFQKGLEQQYALATYAELRLSEDGSTLLVGLRDAERKPISTTRD